MYQVINILWPHCCTLFPRDNKFLFVCLLFVCTSHETVTDSVTMPSLEMLSGETVTILQVGFKLAGSRKSQTNKSPNKIQITKIQIFRCERNLDPIKSLRGTLCLMVAIYWFYFRLCSMYCVKKKKRKKKLKFNTRWFGLELRKRRRALSGQPVVLGYSTVIY